MAMAIPRPDKNGDDIILHTPSGNVIKAKTPNQKKLVDMSQNKDLHLCCRALQEQGKRIQQLPWQW